MQKRLQKRPNYNLKSYIFYRPSALSTKNHEREKQKIIQWLPVNWISGWLRSAKSRFYCIFRTKALSSSHSILRNYYIRSFFPDLNELYQLSERPRFFRSEDDVIFLKNWFHKELCERNINCPFRWYLLPEPNLQVSPYHFAYLEPLLRSTEFQEASNRKNYIEQKMGFGFEVICEIANATILQWDSSDFCKIREFRLTASNFGSVIDSIYRNSFPPSLFAKLLENTKSDKTVCFCL